MVSDFMQYEGSAQKFGFTLIKGRIKGMTAYK